MLNHHGRAAVIARFKQVMLQYTPSFLNSHCGPKGIGSSSNNEFREIGGGDWLTPPTD